MSEEPCAEQFRLLAAVTSSVLAVNAAKAALDQAKKEKRSIATYRAALAAARAVGRGAVAALAWHKKVHGCTAPIEYSGLRDTAATASM